MLCFSVYIESDPRLLFSFPNVAAILLPRHLPKSFPLNPFAAPHPLTPFASILYKNIGGRALGISHFPKSFICNTYKKTGGVGVLWLTKHPSEGLDR